jgi:hypothetical protein
MLRSFIQTTAIILTLVGAIFVIRVNIGLTPETIAKLSCTIQGWFQWATANKEAVSILAKQSADTRIGFIFLIIAFLLQMINLLWPMTLDELGAVNRPGVLISIGCCVILIFFAYCYSKYSANKQIKESVHIIEQMLHQKEIGK